MSFQSQFQHLGVNRQHSNVHTQIAKGASETCASTVDPTRDMAHVHTHHLLSKRTILRNSPNPRKSTNTRRSTLSRGDQVQPRAFGPLQKTLQKHPSPCPHVPLIDEPVGVPGRTGQKDPCFGPPFRRSDEYQARSSETDCASLSDPTSRECIPHNAEHRGRVVVLQPINQRTTRRTPPEQGHAENRRIFHLFIAPTSTKHTRPKLTSPHTVTQRAVNPSRITQSVEGCTLCDNTPRVTTSRGALFHTFFHRIDAHRLRSLVTKTLQKHPSACPHVPLINEPVGGPVLMGVWKWKGAKSARTRPPPE